MFSSKSMTRGHQVDLELALTLAGVACDAYLAPKHGDFPHVRDGQDNEVETTYLDGDFLASEYKHVLKVVIKRAVNCKAQDTSTVFVELRVGDSHANSEPVPATAEPTWNETKYLLVRAPTDRLEVNLHDWQMLDFARKRGGLSDEDKKLTDAQLLAKLQNDGGELLHQMQRRNELMKKVQHRRSTAIRLDSRLNSESQLDEQPAPRSRPRSNAVVPVSADGRLVVQQKTGGGAMVSFIRGLSMRRGGGQLGTVKDDDGDYDGEFNDLPDEPEEECHGTSGLDKEGLTHDLVIPMSGGDLDGAEVHLTATLLPITPEVVRKLRLPRMTIKSAVDIDLVRRSRRGQQAEEDRKEESTQSGRVGRGEPAKANAGKAHPAAAAATAAAGKVGSTMVLGSTEDEILELDGIPAVPGRTFSYSSGKAGSGAAVAPSGGSGSSKKEALVSSDAQQQQAGGAEAVDADEDITASDKGSEVDPLEEGYQSDESEKAEASCYGFCAPAPKVEFSHTSMSIKHQYVPVMYIFNQRTDTHVWIYRRIDRRELVLAIRGTASVENAVTDLKFFQEPYEESEISPNKWMRRWMRVFGSSEVVMCHRGFLRAFRSVKEKVLGVLAKLTDDDYRTKGPWRLFITGHSLGGGLATLFAHELALKQPSLMASGRRIKLTVYTYGCPRVGNQKFADNYNSLVTDSWRFVTPKDLVPKIPRGLAYKHVKHCVWIHKTGLIQNEAIDGRAAVLAQVNKLQRAGVKHHLGKYYIRTMQAVVAYGRRYQGANNRAGSLRRAPSRVR